MPYIYFTRRLNSAVGIFRRLWMRRRRSSCSPRQFLKNSGYQYTHRLVIVYNWPKVGWLGAIWPDLNLYLAKSGVFCIFVAKYNTIMVGSQLKGDLHGNRLTLLGRFNCFILHDDWFGLQSLACSTNSIYTITDLIVTSLQIDVSPYTRTRQRAAGSGASKVDIFFYSIP